MGTRWGPSSGRWWPVSARWRSWDRRSSQVACRTVGGMTSP